MKKELNFSARVSLLEQDGKVMLFFTELASLARDQFPWMLLISVVYKSLLTNLALYEKPDIVIV